VYLQEERWDFIKVQSSVAAEMKVRGQTKSAQEAKNRTRVLIVNSHPITRTGLAHMINDQPDLVLCDEAGNAAKVLDALNTNKPDLVLSELTLPDKSALELIKDIKAMRPELPVLVISMHDESLYAERVLRAGARGYIMKDASGEELMHAIRSVLNGEIYVTKKISSHVLETFSGGTTASSVRSSIEQLSDREFEVFELIGLGLSACKIAQRLSLSAKTVDAHRAKIKRKLHIKSASELISFAARWLTSRGGGSRGVSSEAASQTTEI
jgi:DNA-binding NarL/FixJ family response regulator